MSAGEQEALAPAVAGAEAAVETAVAGPRVVLFDFDGVLIHGDAFSLFIRDRYARSLVRRALALLCLPLLALGFPLSRWWPARVLVRIGLLGVGERRYAVLARAFGATLVRRPKQFCRDGLQALRRHQAAGDRVVVVTGCEEHLVRSILDELGLPGLEVLASRLATGWLGMKTGLHNVGRRKLQRLEAHGIDDWALAYSDSLLDLPMLKRAAGAVLVNGTPALCKKLEKAMGRPFERVTWY
jgi:phosphatidylglycerophosphatase C